ncbi:rhamnulokinase [Paenibacillus odorifer]|uniref:rhamnulokinase n=1 Tax=Paenibacillus TaxID=44249 RepID=UPI00096E52DD|nr:rhamnulokinase [Paenibacillus odorifer]OME26879.1 rhamnulokinase [Paenibacillus odorifer]OME32994.1 rhamnulokinase [Paenibacillus odorifer]
MNNHIAVDIGASSGRLVRGILQEGILSLEELHRFSNSFTEQEGSCFWDIDYLVEQIMIGLQKAKTDGITTCTLGIDTWGVDYVLVDADGNRVQEVYAYRDRRTDLAVDLVAKQLSPQTVYEKTGIQQLSINTLNQLYVHNEEELAQADQILLVPDYLYYRLTGRKINEVTIASTTQLLNLESRDFDDDLLEFLNIRKDQFSKLTEPGVVVGPLDEALIQQYDLPECQLICVASHDTASAVLGAPLQEGSAYISSGTWSLLGVERTEPLNSLQAMQANYTNEWGAYGTYRFLKNVMGLWLIQEVRRLLNNRYSFTELAELAQGEEGFRSLIPCNAPRFLNPSNMIEEIRSACMESGQPIPETPGQLARCVFDSLALSYLTYLEELEELTEGRIEGLQIVGGGANNRLLCQLTADVIGREVKAGPTEATALGNIVVQMISTDSIADITEARAIIEQSFEITSYIPQPIKHFDNILNRWRSLHLSRVNELI